MRWTALILVALSVAGPIDAHRLRTGRFVYHDLDPDHAGREIGRGELTIRRLPAPERYEFSAEITGKFDQRWTAIATPAFEPISATITFGRDTAPRFSLAYHAGRVTGFVVRGSRRSVDTVVPAGTVDQRIDWAAVMAADLAPGREFHFSVYDPSIGVSTVSVSVSDVQRLTVLAGTFDVYPITYRIAKATGTEQYQVFATRDVPRMAVREIFPNGVVSDLGEIATLTSPAQDPARDTSGR